MLKSAITFMTKLNVDLKRQINIIIQSKHFYQKIFSDNLKYGLKSDFKFGMYIQASINICREKLIPGLEFNKVSC